MVKIKTTNLSYIYSKGTPFEKNALNNIDLEIQQGEFIGIIGHTGSGKSTLIQNFNGLLKPSKGEVYVNGKNIWNNIDKVYEYRFKIGIAFQYPEHQLFQETVFKDVAFGPTNMGLGQDDISHRVKWAMNIVGLSNDYLDKSPFELSGGQKRRIALAGIISMDPEVLVLDEPTAGLDPKGRKLLLENIHEYQKNKKNTIILVSHNMEEVSQYCKSIIVMNKSSIYMTGLSKEIFSQTDKLKSIGLEIPVITQIFKKLSDDGFHLRKDIHTVNDAVDYLDSLFIKL